ncbi:DUF1254 domain-containing protein [Williamsia muralis]|uniref:DUF1254 domain-containing protein n=1 Tax=Williamsia marianensis TaxID=85044 RepID=A0ABU4EVM0_WILMA|nr:DUF1254 domain-containing protein [Williamsia muralis]MDV7135286.1 DUF1254 domain-containing protein [Williamsia muralis]
MSSDDLRAIAADAFTFGYAMVENYRTMYAQAIDSFDPRYTGGFGNYRHYPDPARPENTDIVTPNNDTPYSWLWLDLRTEPYVVTVPAIDRYYILPFHDLYTLYAGYVGAVTSGPDAGSYLLVGPSWDGAVPDGIDGVIHSTTEFLGSLTRTALMPDGVESMKRIQESYRVEPLSAFARTPPPQANSPVQWPVWDEEAFTTTTAFYELVDFLLQFAPPLEEDAEVRKRMEAAGMRGDGSFRVDDLDDSDRAAWAAGLTDGIKALQEHAGHAASSIGLFGTHQQMAGKYTNRNIAAKKGLYGLPPSEAWYAGWITDSAGDTPVGTSSFTVTFDAGHLPKVRFFWSATMYRLPERLLVDNPIDRYSIGDRTPGIVYGPDNSLTLHISHAEPTDPAARANWLPAPPGPFTVIIRAYGGDREISEGRYTLPPLVPNT